MLGGADNPNGELPSYITGADTCSLYTQSLALKHTYEVYFGIARLSSRRLRQWVIRADVPCCVTTSSPNVKCVRQKEQGESYRLKEKRKAGVLTKNTTPISDDEMVQSGQHQ